MHDQRRHVELLEVLGEVGLGKCLGYGRLALGIGLICVDQVNAASSIREHEAGDFIGKANLPRDDENKTDLSIQATIEAETEQYRCDGNWNGHSRVRQRPVQAPFPDPVHRSFFQDCQINGAASTTGG